MAKFRQSPPLRVPKTPPSSSIPTILTAAPQLSQARLVTIGWLVRTTLELEGQYRCLWCRDPGLRRPRLELQRKPRIQTLHARAGSFLPKSEVCLRPPHIPQLTALHENIDADLRTVGRNKSESTRRHRRRHQGEAHHSGAVGPGRIHSYKRTRRENKQTLQPLLDVQHFRTSMTMTW